MNDRGLAIGAFVVLGALVGCSDAAKNTGPTIIDVYPDNATHDPNPPPSPTGNPDAAPPPSYDAGYGAACNVDAAAAVTPCFGDKTAKQGATLDKATGAVTLECTPAGGGPTETLLLANYVGTGEYYNMNFSDGPYMGLCHAILLDAPPVLVSGSTLKGSLRCNCIEDTSSKTLVNAVGTIDVTLP